MKPHYFNQPQADVDDVALKMCKGQGYVPETCLLGGDLVYALAGSGKDPCEGCVCDRAKCKGRPKKSIE